MKTMSLREKTLGGGNTIKEAYYRVLRTLQHEPRVVPARRADRVELRPLPDHKTDFSKGVRGKNDGDLWNATVSRDLIEDDGLSLIHRIENVKEPFQIEVVFKRATLEGGKVYFSALVPQSGRIVEYAPGSIISFSKTKHFSPEEVQEMKIKTQPWQR